MIAQEPSLFDCGEEIVKDNGLRAAAILLEAERKRLVVIVAQNAGRDFIRDGGKPAIASRAGQFSARQRRLHQDFQVDFMVGHVDAGGIIDGVGIYAATGERVLDPRLLRETEIAAFDDHFAAQFVGTDTAGVVGMIADLGVGFVAGTHVGSDAAIVKEVDLGPHNRLYQTVGIKFGRVAFERRANFSGQDDAFQAAAENAPALTDQCRVVIAPLGAGLIIEPLAFRVAFGWVRIGVDEDVAMVEGGDELDVFRLKQPVAEDVARHVADPHDRNRCAAANLPAHLAKVALGRFPCAACGNT